MVERFAVLAERPDGAPRAHRVCRRIALLPKSLCKDSGKRPGSAAHIKRSHARHHAGEVDESQCEQCAVAPHPLLIRIRRDSELRHPSSPQQGYERRISLATRFASWPMKRICPGRGT
jgi:hypothetical protein